MSKERFDIHQHITDKIVSAIERAPATSACPGTAPPAASCGPSTSHRRSRIAASTSWRFGPTPRNPATAPALGHIPPMVRGRRSGAQGREGRLRRLLQGARIRRRDRDRRRRYDHPPFRPRHAGIRRRAGRRLSASGHRRPAYNGHHADREAEAFVRDLRIHQPRRRPGLLSARDESIQLPPRQAFTGTATSTPAEAYYSTLLHELTHNAATRIMPHGLCWRLVFRASAMRGFGIIKGIGDTTLKIGYK